MAGRVYSNIAEGGYLLPVGCGQLLVENHEICFPCEVGGEVSCRVSGSTPGVPAVHALRDLGTLNGVLSTVFVGKKASSPSNRSGRVAATQVVTKRICDDLPRR